MSSSYTKEYTPKLSTDGLYDPSFEHEACGVGLVANIRGVKSHGVIKQGLEVLIKLGHRGAAGADPETGDGAGIMMQMPHEFIDAEFGRLGARVPVAGSYGIGMTYLPQDAEERASCEETVERIVEEEGQQFLGWPRRSRISRQDRYASRARDAGYQAVHGRKVGDDRERQGVRAAAVRHPQADRKGDSWEMTCRGAASSIFAASPRRRSFTRGLIMAHQLESFYHDLGSERMITSFALVHSRFSTNTLGAWRLAHPYRFIIHNGEINTLQGNINWMTAPREEFPLRPCWATK